MHDQVPLNPVTTIRLAHAAHAEYMENVDKQSCFLACIPVSRLDSRPLHWSFPPRCYLKINCDAAFDSSSRRGGVGIAIRNWEGDVMCCQNLLLLGDDAESLEGQAVFHALLTAHCMGLESVIVETDCSTLFQALSGSGQVSPWVLACVVGDIFLLRDSFSHCTFGLVPPSANKAVDWIARRALKDRFFPRGISPPS